MTKRAGVRLQKVPNGSRPKEGAESNPNVATENPAHAPSQENRIASTLGTMKAINSLDLAPGMVTREAFVQRRSARLLFAAAPVRVRAHDPLPLHDAVAFWFAMSSPLIGLVLGFLGAWFVTWLTG